jgi:hypothetical protein
MSDPKPIGRNIHDIANELSKKSETKPELKKVDLPPKPELHPVVHPLERFWAWINGYADQQIVNAAAGMQVANPFSLISSLSSLVARWKIIAAIVVIIGILFVILRSCSG